MKRAVIAVSPAGVRLARVIKNRGAYDVFSLPKYADGIDIIPMKQKLQAFMKDAFLQYREIILIMSCGIAVRSIAPWLDSKLKDPAVVVCDDTGKYVISLLSGHIGGANELAAEIAGITGGAAVITTASDNRGITAVDMLAKRLGLEINDFKAAKLVTAAMVNGKKVGLVDEYKTASGLASDPCLIHLKEDGQWDVDALIYLGNKARLETIGRQMDYVILSKKCLVIGVGCRKGTEPQKLIGEVNALLGRSNLAHGAVLAIATIDLKAQEPAVVELARCFNVELVVIEKEEIEKIEDQFESSEFVRKSIGVGAVCEPAAYIASRYGKRLVPKTKAGGITISIYEVREPEGSHEK